MMLGEDGAGVELKTRDGKVLSPAKQEEILARATYMRLLQELDLKRLQFQDAADRYVRALAAVREEAQSAVQRSFQ